jgi:hypothetical protein
MNLGKLLGAGKSFVSGRKSAAYRADRRVYLPQFVSPKNPFAGSSAAVMQAELPKSSAQNPAAPEKKVVPTWIKTQKMPELKAQGATARATAWVSKLNPISIFRASPSFMDKMATPVQVELSLEKVKVIQNDLTDADVEIVPMKSRPARVLPMDNPPAKKSWEQLGERIMKATAL